MLTTREEILARLADLGIEATTVDHPPVFTVEQAREHTAHLPGGHCKNLFLKDKKDRLWLVTCLDERKVDLNALSNAAAVGLQLREGSGINDRGQIAGYAFTTGKTSYGRGFLLTPP